MDRGRQVKIGVASICDQVNPSDFHMFEALSLIAGEKDQLGSRFHSRTFPGLHRVEFQTFNASCVLAPCEKIESLASVVELKSHARPWCLDKQSHKNANHKSGCLFEVRWIGLYPISTMLWAVTEPLRHWLDWAEKNGEVNKQMKRDNKCPFDERWSQRGNCPWKSGW